MLRKIKISEIFSSVQGEGPNMGKPSIFLRTALCNLTCSWCDTKYTWDWDSYDYKEQVKEMNLDDIEIEVTKYNIENLVITGGEPMIQQDSLLILLKKLKEKKKFYVEVETNGTIKPSNEMESIIDQWNVSPKLSNSENSVECREIPEVYQRYSQMKNAFFKFVVDKISDFDEIEEIVSKYNLLRNKVIIMPQASTKMDLESKEKILRKKADSLGYGFSDRLHVKLWEGERGK